MAADDHTTAGRIPHRDFTRGPAGETPGRQAILHENVFVLARFEGPIPAIGTRIPVKRKKEKAKLLAGIPSTI
jgi:hypothetical protein